MSKIRSDIVRRRGQGDKYEINEVNRVIALRSSGLVHLTEKFNGFKRPIQTICKFDKLD